MEYAALGASLDRDSNQHPDNHKPDYQKHSFSTIYGNLGHLKSPEAGCLACLICVLQLKMVVKRKLT